MSGTSVSIPTYRWAAVVEYDGSFWNGWQTQSNAQGGIQAQVERALTFVAGHPVEVVCAGRTDTGVHAVAQVIHFDSFVERSPHSWVMGANSNLPPSVSLKAVSSATSTFHARFSAEARRYQYVIHNAKYRSALSNKYATWRYHFLDHTLMDQAAQHLIGSHDFSSFRAKDCQSLSATRDVFSASVQRKGDWLLFDIVANAFLYHMIRNIVGTLFPIGEGKASPDWVQEVLAQKDRGKAGVTAPPNGLYFVGVKYPDDLLTNLKTWDYDLPIWS